jgi:hypothetical protein
MQTTLRFLGYICLILAVGWVMCGLVDPIRPAQLLPAVGLFLVGIILLAFAEILKRLRYIEFLIETTPGAGSHRVKTPLGDFELLDDVEGEAICVGCKKTAPRAGMYYSTSLDVHYHPACLARDRKRG